MNWEQLLNDQRQGERILGKQKGRSRFEQDYDRIVFSHPFRMLQDKTQVFPLPKQDFVHTRLTHSLEVASVGRSLGKLAGERIIAKYPELKELHLTAADFGSIISAASLMHDIGNPPFGHAGENAISQFFKEHALCESVRSQVQEKEWSDLTQFEGNAQGFRIVNKQNYQGLKLTFATLGAFTKYPRESLLSERDSSRKSQKKYGFHQFNKEAFSAVAESTGLIDLGSQLDATWCRHPLAFLVEAADDICYNIIDLEDGTNLGLVSLDETRQLLSSIVGDAFDPRKFDSIPIEKEKVSVLRAMAIYRLVDECVDAFIDQEENMRLGNFDAALTDTIDSAKILKEIQALSFEKIYKSQPVIEREVAGFEVLSGLLEVFIPAILDYHENQKGTWYHSSLMRLLPGGVKLNLDQSANLYEALLCLMDFISGMTDSYALSLYRTIKGISLPGQ